MLSYDAEKFLSQEEFLDCCESTISPKDFQVLKSAGIIPTPQEETGHPVLDKWNSWERSLRNDLVKMRAGHKGVDAEKYFLEGSVETGVYNIARDAYTAATPLEAEMILDRARWAYLENLEAGHHFDLGKLIVYYLQLQLLQRKARMVKEQGKTSFDEIYAAITERAVFREPSNA
jgi:hypothetical protein